MEPASIFLGQRAMNDLRLAVFEHIQRLSLNYFDRTHQGRILARADTDVDSLGKPPIAVDVAKIAQAYGARSGGTLDSIPAKLAAAEQENPNG